MSQLGDTTGARNLAVTYLSHIYGSVKDANPTFSLHDYLTT